MAQTDYAIAAAIASGVDPASDFNITRFKFDTHSHLVVEYLCVPGVEGATPLAVADAKAKASYTRVPGQKFFMDFPVTEDAGAVDALFAEVMKIQRLKNVTVMPMIEDAIPLLKTDPDMVVVQGQDGKLFGGKIDVDGNLGAFVSLPTRPTFSVDDSGSLVMDAGALSADDTAKAQAVMDSPEVAAAIDAG